MKEINKREVGTDYEKIAGRFLENKGLKVLKYNYRVRFGEIDIIAKDREYLVFVEVKYRKTDKSGRAVYAVDNKKQRNIGKVALAYLTYEEKNTDIPCRFDCVAIDGSQINWVKNAFEVRQ